MFVFITQMLHIDEYKHFNEAAIIILLSGFSPYAVVVVRLPRPMEENWVIPIFRSLQNCQFHHRRLESLEHFNVHYKYIILRTTVSHYWTLQMFFLLQGLPFFVYISIFASGLCMCVMCYVFNVNLTDYFDDRRS